MENTVTVHLEVPPVAMSRTVLLIEPTRRKTCTQNSQQSVIFEFWKAGENKEIGKVKISAAGVYDRLQLQKTIRLSELSHLEKILAVYKSIGSKPQAGSYKRGRPLSNADVSGRQKAKIVQIIVVPMECVCQTQAGAMGRMTVEMEVMSMTVDPAIRLTSYAIMEGVLVHPVCATITMTVETTVMNLDAVLSTDTTALTISIVVITGIVYIIIICITMMARGDASIPR
ncbi:hypothetical protein EMCRGX_G019583 [Ephydatia muelleri]